MSNLKNAKNKKQQYKKKSKKEKSRKEDDSSEDEIKSASVSVRPSTKYTDLNSALAAYRLPCSAEGTLRWFLEAYGVPTYFPVSWHDPNPTGHPVAHAMRLYAVIQIARDVCARTGKNTIHILDYYGRDWRAFRLPVSEEGIGVVFHPYRPHTYAGDPARAVVTDTIIPPVYDALIAVDIYLHVAQTEPFGAEAFASVLAQTGIERGYVVTQDLRELFGQHVYHASRQTTEGNTQILSREGSWESIDVAGVRHVVFMPDRNTLPYPPHAYKAFSGTEAVPLPDSVDGEQRSAHFHQMTSCGYYQIFACMIHVGPWSPVTGNLQALPRYVQVNYDQYVWQRKLSNKVAQVMKLIPKTWFAAASNLNTSQFMDVVVPDGMIEVRGLAVYDTVALSALSTPFMGKSVNGRVVGSMLALVQDRVDENQSLRDRYPQQRAAVILNTLMVYLSNRPEDEFILSTVDAADHRIDTARREFAAGKPVEARYGFLASVGQIASRNWWKVAVAAIAIFMVRRRSLGLLGCLVPPSAAAWRFGTAEPYSVSYYATTALEEVVKATFGWPSAALLAVVEACKAFYDRRTLGAPIDPRSMLVVRTPGTILHVITACAYAKFGYLALPMTIPFHWMWNKGISVAASVPGPFADAVYGNSIAPHALYTSFGWLSISSIGTWCKWIVSLFFSGQHHDPDDLDLLRQVRTARWIGSAEDIHKLRAVLPLTGSRIPSTPCVDWVSEYVDRRDHPHFPDQWLDWRHKDVTIEFAGRVWKPSAMNKSELRSLLKDLEWSHYQCTCEGLSLAGEACSRCAEAPDSDFMYPLVVSPGLLFKPSSSPASCLTAFFTRWYFSSTPIEASVRDESTFNASLRRLLSTGSGLLREVVLAGRESENWFTVEECAAAMPNQKGRRLQEGQKQDLYFGALVQEALSKGAPKANETIKADFSSGEAKVKTRAIIDVDPSVQSVILPRSRAWTKDLKRIFDGSVIMRVGNYDVRFIITKAKKKNLDSYALLASSCQELCVFVSCDDTIMFTGRYEEEFGYSVMESDYGSYDQTQRQAFWQSLWHILDVDTEWASLHDRVNSAPAVYRNRRLGVRIVFPLRYAMRTGVGTTSIFGSVNNIQAYVYWLLERVDRPFLEFDRAAKELGLTAKVSMHSDWSTATFLKGFFSQTGWSPLVSCCLKLSKSGKYTDCPEGLWFGIMQSVKVPLDYPILGAMKRKAIELVGSRDGQLSPAVDRAIRQSHDINFIENRYKVLESEASREEVLFHMLHRYGVDESLVLEAEAQIMSISSLPVMLVHPIYDVMRSVDYN
jgi:hypothetical protein